jgi:hypothetical protein
MNIDDSRLIVRFQGLITEMLVEKRLGQRRVELTDELYDVARSRTTRPQGDSRVPRCTVGGRSARLLAHCISLWRSFGEILNYGHKSLRPDFHRAGERMINFHNGQQAGKN